MAILFYPINFSVFFSLSVSTFLLYLALSSSLSHLVLVSLVLVPFFFPLSLSPFPPSPSPSPFDIRGGRRRAKGAGGIVELGLDFNYFQRVVGEVSA